MDGSKTVVLSANIMDLRAVVDASGSKWYGRAARMGPRSEASSAYFVAAEELASESMDCCLDSRFL